MIEKELVKKYLYIDISEDDEIIDFFIDKAKAYLKSAIDDFDAKYEAIENFAKQADQYALFYVSEMYQNRNIYAEGTEPSYHLNALMLQLQTYILEDEENE